VSFARRGDQAAFERLYRRHVGRIRGLARRLADFDEADEITQDVFVRAWEKLAGFRGASSFGTWLHRLAVNLIIERHRRSFRRSSWLTGDETALDHVAVGDRDGAFSMDFAAAVRRLPAGARRVFVLYDVEGYRHDEIGKLMGISVGTSKAQLHRARMILRRYLDARQDAAPNGARPAMVRAAAGGGDR
jgi:RNA polymerase sigma factor (sigma-70 family)